MEWEFGQNCCHLVPTMGKCRVAINSYRKRNDLVETKWVSTRDMLIYLDLAEDEIFRQIVEGEIKVKTKKDGTISFGIIGAWAWDDCALINDGGMCFHFQPHDGKKIKCLLERKDVECLHPNLDMIPTEEAIKHIEMKVQSLSRKA